MKILVTGGCGFIGSHIVDKLIRLGNQVIILDNLSTGKKENLNPKAKFFYIDINDTKVEDIFKTEKPDYVIHQAAHVDVVKSLKDPIFDAKTNILGSLNILENCRKYGVKKIVYGNSGGAGPGEPKYVPIDEEHPVNPLCPYGVSKHSVEHYLKIYSRLYNLKYTSLRYANVYGPRQDPFGEGGVVAIFVHKLLHNEAPRIFGSGNQTRDFVFVEDVADANILAIKKGDNECFNVGTGIETSINKLFQALKKLCKSSINPEYAEARKEDIIRSSLNNSKIRTIGWNPSTNLEEGLKKTIDWYKNK